MIGFDRIRENRRKYKRMRLPELINLSTNQIATRNHTGVCGDRAVDAAASVLRRPGAVQLLRRDPVGILVGTFSSTYVAAALLLYLPAPAGTIEGPAEASA
ncbi:MAG: hypothetical protein WDM89_14950 [Rhizomicrobium sp.]